MQLLCLGNCVYCSIPITYFGVCQCCCLTRIMFNLSFKWSLYWTESCSLPLNCLKWELSWSASPQRFSFFQVCRIFSMNAAKLISSAYRFLSWRRGVGLLYSKAFVGELDFWSTFNGFFKGKRKSIRMFISLLVASANCSIGIMYYVPKLSACLWFGQISFQIEHHCGRPCWNWQTRATHWKSDTIVYVQFSLFSCYDWPRGQNFFLFALFKCWWEDGEAIFLFFFWFF